MRENDKSRYLADLDEQLLLGGVILSEWATFLVNDADTAFASGAHLASIITGLAGVETHLRGEGGTRKTRFVELIEESDLDPGLKHKLQLLRRYRNRSAHVTDPWDDGSLLDRPEEQEHELEEMVWSCAVAFHRAIYLCEPVGMRPPNNAIQPTLVPRAADGRR